MNVSRGIEGRAQPLDPLAFDRDEIEAAGRRRREPAEEVPGREDQPLLPAEVDRRRRAAMARICPCPDLHEHKRAVEVTQDQVDFRTASPRTARTR